MSWKIAKKFPSIKQTIIDNRYNFQVDKAIT